MTEIFPDGALVKIEFTEESGNTKKPVYLGLEWPYQTTTGFSKAFVIGKEGSKKEFADLRIQLARDKSLTVTGRSSLLREVIFTQLSSVRPGEGLYVFATVEALSCGPYVVVAYGESVVYRNLQVSVAGRQLAGRILQPHEV